MSFTYYVDNLSVNSMTSGSGIQFPEVDGSTGDVLVTDGSGVLSFKTNDSIFCEQNIVVTTINDEDFIEFNNIMYNNGSITVDNNNKFTIPANKNYIIEFSMIDFSTRDPFTIDIVNFDTKVSLGFTQYVTKSTSVPSISLNTAFTRDTPIGVMFSVNTPIKVSIVRSILRITQV